NQKHTLNTGCTDMIFMVSSRRVRLKVEIDIDIPTDLIENNDRRNIIEDGIIKSISKGLYEEGISFHIKKFHFDV
ncbi:MAG: hypothetical protein ACM31J_06015, partial [Nitrososphaerales archaeon]